MNEDDMNGPNLQEKQKQALSEISKGIWKTSTKFDLDNEEDSPLDKLVEDKVVIKSLENDNLIFMEGRRKMV